jgi:cytochrome c biogenesis protein CcdA
VLHEPFFWSNLCRTVDGKASFVTPLSLSVVSFSFCFIQVQNIQRLKEERDNVLQQNQQMQRELVQHINHLFLNFAARFYMIILAFGFWSHFFSAQETWFHYNENCKIKYFSYPKI